MTVMGITTRGSDMQWLDRAACRAHDPELFFPVSAIGPGHADTEAAKRVCRACPVLAECLEWAIAGAIPFGVVGGLSEDERRAVARGTRRRVPILAEQAAHLAGSRRDAHLSARGQLSDFAARSR
jgi:WhiB family transcriptional regulator, redox-sensing transcriptional regulator